MGQYGRAASSELRSQRHTLTVRQTRANPSIIVIRGLSVTSIGIALNYGPRMTLMRRVHTDHPHLTGLKDPKILSKPIPVCARLNQLPKHEEGNAETGRRAETKMSLPTRIIATTFAIIAPAVVSAAQTPEPASPPTIQILSQKWSKIAIVQDSEEPDYNVIPAPSRSPAPNQTRTLKATRYLFEAKVKNIGDKVIRAMRWDYVFTDPDTQDEIDRRRFYSTITIHPNHEKTLEGYTRSAPMEIVSARALRNERVVIECITLSDGTTWRLPSYKGKCAPTKQVRPPPPSQPG
jgi:hypothetical protein